MRAGGAKHVKRRGGRTQGPVHPVWQSGASAPPLARLKTMGDSRLRIFVSPQAPFLRDPMSKTRGALLLTFFFGRPFWGDIRMRSLEADCRDGVERATGAASTRRTAAKASGLEGPLSGSASPAERKR